MTLWDGPSHKFIHMRLLYTLFNPTFCTGVSVHKHNLRTLQLTFTGVTTHRPHTEKTPAMHWDFDALWLSFGTVGWQRGEMGLGAGCATHSLGFLLIPESIAGLPPICLTPCNMGCGKRCEVSGEIS